MTGYEGDLSPEEQEIYDEMESFYGDYGVSPYYEGRQWCNNMFMSMDFRGKSRSWQDFPGTNSFGHIQVKILLLSPE